MKAVILAGGRGTRLAEETSVRPKPMVEIGGRPILWHIMKYFAHFGVTDFVICLGYKGFVIKEFFANYFLHTSDITINIARNEVHVHHVNAEPWSVTLVDTGEDTMTGGRLKRVRQHLGDNDFFFTYGDGLSDVNIDALKAFHRTEATLATVTAVQPPGRFGSLNMERDKIVGFQEKPQGDGGWINGGFFILSPEVLNFIDGDETVWEQHPMERLAKSGNLSAFLHRGFWQPMDTMRDNIRLQQLWDSGNAPWKVW